MSIKFAVLSLIAERPQHGYAVRREFEDRVMDIRDVGFGQIYQILQSLQRSGYAKGRRDPNLPKRVVFSVTDRGREALELWLSGHEVRSQGFQDDIFFRLLFASPEVMDSLLDLLHEQTASAVEELAMLVDERRRLRANAGYPEVSRRLFLEAQILHREADIRGLEMARKVFESMQRGAQPAEAVEDHLPVEEQRMASA